MTIDYTRPPQPPQTPSPTGQPPSSWWGRNWKWVVTIGCLTPVILIGGCIAGLVLFVFSAIRSSDPYQEAVRRAQANPEVVSRLGTPIETKWWITGNVNVKNDTGDANLVIPLRGPKGDGAIHVQGTKDGGKWTYSRMTFESNGTQINLLEEPSPPESTDTAPPGA
jgi:hypothetical protein